MFAEKERDTPKRWQSYKCEYDTAYNVCWTAEDPWDDIKLKKTDASPVDSAYDQNNKSYFVKHDGTYSFSNLGSFPMFPRQKTPWSVLFFPMKNILFAFCNTWQKNSKAI